MIEQSVAIPQVRPCRHCGDLLNFWDNCRTIAGKRIPYNPDGSRHVCKRAWDDERAISSAIAFIADLNSKLQTAELGLTRKDKGAKV